MPTVQEIKKAISTFGPKELSRFRSWYENFDAANLDKQFEEDVKSGKLDNLSQKALNDLKKGNCREL